MPDSQTACPPAAAALPVCAPSRPQPLRSRRVRFVVSRQVLRHDNRTSFRRGALGSLAHLWSMPSAPSRTNVCTCFTIRACSPSRSYVMRLPPGPSRSHRRTAMPRARSRR
ncbi:hypothetical protein E2562_035896 [Oryza meyeriana var. granulata]|uniref:Uncharacterized protein n=1 Tax=Oryza meyeriana var. granulata TaxID=110450 RepID=A0A6G1E767_9ORYZ|nr:hypothetical protein E2562_035896 [Oryza meyeriana var. granulata]